MTMLSPMRIAVALILAGLVGLGACGKKTDSTTSNTPPRSDMPAGVHVMSVALGRTIGPDKRITNATEQFAPTETIYASVETHGTASSATLLARWTYEDGQLVEESSQSIAPSGMALTEFHISKPSGWPTGKYQLAVLLDGKPAATKSFVVAG